MNETKTAQRDSAKTEECRDKPGSPGDIRVLEGFELMLAGGGDGEVTWP